MLTTLDLACLHSYNLCPMITLYELYSYILGIIALHYFGSSFEAYLFRRLPCHEQLNDDDHCL